MTTWDYPETPYYKTKPTPDVSIEYRAQDDIFVLRDENHEILRYVAGSEHLQVEEIARELRADRILKAARRAMPKDYGDF